MTPDSAGSSRTRQCAYDPDCKRAPRPTSPSGTVYANCWSHDEQLVPSWHTDARLGVLRPAIVGGLPIERRHDRASCAGAGGTFPRALPETSAGRAALAAPTG
jgi:hypothetical protein